MVTAVTAVGSLKIRKRQFSIAPYKESWHEYEAFDGEHLVGRAVSFEAPRGSGDCWLHDLWIAPECRRSGVGSELLRETIENARAHHYLRMLGELRPYDGAPIDGLAAFFRCHGFIIDANWERTGKPVVMLLLA
ncbi:MAG: GNAT family N-acetyltransferase [Chloroflexi bacterium]|nr:GNAT family N-acetyltransferase [Chloroflexota bacterium]